MSRERKQKSHLSDQPSDDFVCIIKAGSRLLSQAVPHQVPSAASVLTVVFEMGTGVTHRRNVTENGLGFPLKTQQYNIINALIALP